MAFLTVQDIGDAVVAYRGTDLQPAQGSYLFCLGQKCVRQCQKVPLIAHLPRPSLHVTGKHVIYSNMECICNAFVFWWY